MIPSRSSAGVPANDSAAACIATALSAMSPTATPRRWMRWASNAGAAAAAKSAAIHVTSARRSQRQGQYSGPLKKGTCRNAPIAKTPAIAATMDARCRPAFSSLDVNRLRLPLHDQRRLRHRLHLLRRHARRELDELQPLLRHVEHAVVGDDPVDAADAGERQVARVEDLLLALLRDVLHRHDEALGRGDEVHRAAH